MYKEKGCLLKCYYDFVLIWWTLTENVTLSIGSHGILKIDSLHALIYFSFFSQTLMTFLSLIWLLSKSSIVHILLNLIWLLPFQWCRPVNWGCRICWLHLCRGVKLLSYEATCWLWVATHNAWGWILVAEQSVTWQRKVMWLATILFGPYWAKRAVGEAWSD